MAVENSSTAGERAEAGAFLDFRSPYDGIYRDLVQVRGHDMEKAAIAVEGVSGVLRLLSAATSGGSDNNDYPRLDANQRSALMCAGICAADVLERFVDWHQWYEVEARAKKQRT